MCGIFGIITPDENAPDTVFKGLLDIEYRGYDSWGVAYLKNNKFEIKKEIGFLPKKMSFPKSKLALGHTRWATHGGVTRANAHPHKDCTGEIVLVHNGIVENYLELKGNLGKHKFLSETDTEVIVHAIEDEYKITSSLKRSVCKVFKSLSGLNALVVSNGLSIVAVKSGSPLVAGVIPDGFLIASDPNALLPHTKKLIFLEDNELIEFNTGLKLYSVENMDEIMPDYKIVEWKHSSADLEDFEHFMLKEIHEQPKIIKNLAQNCEHVNELAQSIKDAYGTYFIGCGSASYACLTGVYLISNLAKKHVNFSIGSEFSYTQDYLTNRSLLIAVSQSGETIDVVEPVNAAKKKGARIAVVTNSLGSTLYRTADVKLMLEAGPEKAVCGTKSFTSMVAQIMLTAFALAQKLSEGEKILLQSAREVEKVLDRSDEIEELAGKLYRASSIYILGRGLSYPLALEAALKIKEVSYIHAEGFAGGELKHGVIALIEKNTPVIVFVPKDETQGAILASAMEVKARGAYVLGIGEEENPVFDYFFKIGDDGASSLIPHIVVIQLLAYFLAVKLDLNPDRPRNLAKSVTVK